VPQLADLPDGRFLLVTAGGGGDGEGLVDWVLAAYESDPGGLPPALVVFGPFMLPDHQAAFTARADRLSKVRTITFDTRLENLLVRAADVCLKEKRRLVLMVRETPLHLGHLRTLTQLAELGAVILPPVPGLYAHPKTVDDIIGHAIGKALDQFGIDAKSFARWTGA